MRQTDADIVEIDKQIDKEIKEGIIPDPNSIDPITGEPLLMNGTQTQDLGKVPKEPDLNSQSSTVDAQAQKDTKKTEI